MKKIYSVILVLCTVFMFVACSNTNTDNKTSDKSQSNNQSQVSDTSDSLVIYFSVTGNTKNVAQSMATTLNAKSLEIVPKESYSDIASDLSEIKKYHTIYIGYPIWWGTNPKIINTLFENYDFSDKNIYLFCTSASSGVEQSVSDLKTAYLDVNIVEGHRFSSSASESDISEWLNNLK